VRARPRSWGREEDLGESGGWAGQHWRRSCAALGGDGSGVECGERDERRGAEERGWSLRARILGFQLVLYDRSAIRAIRLEMDG